MYPSGFYAWDTRAFRPVVRPNNATSASPAHVDMVEVESCAPASDIEIVGVQDSRNEFGLMTPIKAAHPPTADDYAGNVVLDDDDTGKKVSLLPFDRNSNKRKEIWLTFYQMVEVRIPLRGVTRNHAKQLMQSLRTNKYQYSAGLMTVASHVSDRFNSMKLANMLELRERDRFLRSNFSLDIVYCCHLCSCIRKLADSREPGTEWALEPIRFTVIKAPGSEILTDHELLKLTRSINVIFELFL